jgi:hypothetical protein
LARQSCFLSDCISCCSGVLALLDLGVCPFISARLKCTY